MEWMNTEQELPEHDQPVLVYGSIKDGWEVLVPGYHIGYQRHGRWFIENNGDYVDGGYGSDYEDCVVTHWARLPESPH